MEQFTFAVSLILLFIPFFDWTASIILHRASVRADHSNIALRERSRIAVVLAIITSLNAILASVRLGFLNLSNTEALIILTISLLLVSVPNLYWLYLYYSNKLRK